ncbi:MAG: DUF4855 domain-containing protein [Ruminococcaceae bacterium]|nr:DUF4855 domain-containing protein [Oscillospiraceae bacterium]
MKRLIAILLSVLFVLTACGTDGNESSSANSSAEQSQSGTVSADRKTTVISNGAFYTAASPASDNHADSFGAELTDGVDTSDVEAYNDSRLSGFQMKTVTIVIDLGEECEKIYGAAVSYFPHDGQGLSQTLKIDVASSSDGKKWTPYAFYDTTAEPELDKVNRAEFIKDSYVSGRYVRFKVTGNESWVFLSELEVIADVEPKAGISYLDRVYEEYTNVGTVTAPTNGTDVNKEFNKILISKGCTYKFDAKIETDNPDVNTVLTDGNKPGDYVFGSYVGFIGNGETAKITIDLGQEAADIGAIEANFMYNPTSRIHLPLSLTVTAIDASNNRTDLGVLYGTQIEQIGGFTFSLPLKKTASARYIELSFKTIDGMKHFIEEISVYSYRDSMEQSSLYPQVIIEKGEAAEKEGATSDYKNLILKQPQMIFMPVNENAKPENNSKANNPVLTDGVFSTVGEAYDIHNGKFFKFNAGDVRYIIYDLKNLSAVDCFKGSFCKEQSWGIGAPETVSVLLSANGEDWYDAGSFALTATQYNGIVRGELKLKKAVQARYVVFTFAVGQWVGCDELEAYGTEAIANSVALADSGLGLAGGDSVNGSRIEPSADLLDGAKDLCLMYQNCNNTGYTKEELLPYVAYLNEDLEIKDTMFDSFLFLYANTNMPSGAYPYSQNFKSDWQWCIDDLFGEDINLNALEQAAGETKAALNLADDFTYKITVSINYPHKNQKNFGDVDGDGVSEDLTVYANRMKVCKWFVDEVARRFDEANFKNIELVGYYWWHEQIDDESDPDSVKLIKELGDYIHSLDYDYTWIPYFNSNGYDRWEELGFDVACLQPNYVFNLEAPLSNIYNVDKYTKELGMGVEMELHGGCLKEYSYFKRYMEYITLGAELGYMDDTVLMYYQDYTVFYSAAHSGTYFGRTIYDSTYHFMKGDLKNVPDTMEGIAYEGEANKPIFGKIELPEDKRCEIQISALPENGTVVMGNDGSFAFYPAKDFKGETSFSFIYNEMLSWSEDCTVTVTVK